VEVKLGQFQNYVKYDLGCFINLIVAFLKSIWEVLYSVVEVELGQF
jgi:hypothetical protein